MRNNNETVYCLEDYMVDVSFGKLFFKANEIILLLTTNTSHTITHTLAIVISGIAGQPIGSTDDTRNDGNYCSRGSVIVGSRDRNTA